jgi:YVTN family beta-propeller protein
MRPIYARIEQQSRSGWPAATHAKVMTKWLGRSSMSLHARRRLTKTMLDETAASEARARKTDVRTFLIADIRGYTRYSQEFGDKAASQLAQHFADLVRETLAQLEGELLELRGDEALCVFESARTALAAAVDLQRRLRQASGGGSALALGVGVGLDSGEAVPTEGGYRGRALNTAARLCSIAKPGEILASETVVALAGRDESFTFAHRRAARVKGIDARVRFVEVIPDPPLPPVRPPSRDTAATRITTRVVLACLVALLLIAGAAVAAVVVFGAEEDPGLVPANSLAVIDPATNKVSWHVAVGEGPTVISVAAGRAWLLNREQTISLVDVEARSLVKTFGVPATPAGITAAPDGLWVGDSGKPSVLKLAADTARVVEEIDAPPLKVATLRTEGQPFIDGGPMVLAKGALWFLSGDTTLSRIEPRTGQVEARIRYKGLAGVAPAFVAADSEAVWVYGTGALTRIDPESNESVSSVELGVTGRAPAAAGPIAAGLGSVWIADSANNQVLQVAPGSATGSTAPSVVRTIAVGGPPIGVAAAAGALWVAVDNGTVVKADPLSGDVTDTIMVGGNLGGIYADENTVWVTVD